MTSLEFAHDLMKTYEALCKPLCRELQLPQTAFYILMFLANNPAHSTARDIVELRRLQANLVSVNVERLVREGFLCRHPVPGDRRKTTLVCTEKARPIIQRAQDLQAAFFRGLFTGVGEAEQKQFQLVMEQLKENLKRMEREEP